MNNKNKNKNKKQKLNSGKLKLVLSFYVVLIDQHNKLLVAHAKAELDIFLMCVCDQSFLVYGPTFVVPILIVNFHCSPGWHFGQWFLLLSCGKYASRCSAFCISLGSCTKVNWVSFFKSQRGCTTLSTGCFWPISWSFYACFNCWNVLYSSRYLRTTCIFL